MDFILSEHGGSGYVKKFANAIFAYPADVYSVLNQDALPQVGQLTVNDKLIEKMFLIRENGDGRLQPAIQLEPFGNTFIWHNSEYRSSLNNLSQKIRELSGLIIPEKELFNYTRIDVKLYQLDKNIYPKIICVNESESDASLQDFANDNKYSKQLTERLLYGIKNSEPFGAAENVSMRIFTPAKDHYFNKFEENKNRLPSSLIVFPYSTEYSNQVKEFLEKHS